MRRQSFLCALTLTILTVPSLHAQAPPSEQVQVGWPPARRAEPPAASATAEELESRGDQLRTDKAYLDALDYYRAAAAKKQSASIYNKAGITELLMQRYKEARKDFERAIKADRHHADAYNNLGVIHYIGKGYGKAIKEYQEALKLRPDSASFYSNLGAAYFSKRDFERASVAYSQAVQLDPDIFERTSHAGVQAQMSSPDDRAHFDYVVAKLYAKTGSTDRSLQYLRKAMEEGYKAINDVYKDAEFAELRKDPRFTQLMASRPLAIPN